MSVSIDDELAEGGEDARGVLASWLDDYSEGRCDLEDMQASFLSVCRTDPDAPWDALALLDQYTRRGRIEPELAQTLKSDIEKLVFGDGGRPPAAPRPSSPPLTPRTIAHEPARAPPDATMDFSPHAEIAPPEAGDTGARWRKVIAERDAESTRPGTAFIDRTLLRKDREPPALATPPQSPRPTRPVEIRSRPAPERGAGALRLLRDRYELLSIVGRGSSGTVYRAVDRRRTHLSEAARSVAVKVLSADYASQPAALAELEREFHQAQSLAHPNIVSVFDLDRDGDTYFIVMELLDGELLSSILAKLRGRPMRRGQALAIVNGVGAALAHAHGRDVVHADLKPGAVMLTSSGEVRVLDFGFARNRALDLHTAAALHETPAPSPAYASLERVNGSEPDASDDVYSLACIAYELFTGQHPFGGRSALLARAHGRRPPRVRGFNHKQWHSLQRALLWTRGERRIDVTDLLNALGCLDAPAVRVAPEDVLAPEEGGSRWLRAAAWAACVIGAIAGAWYFLPQLAPQFVVGDGARIVDAAPATAPAADREQQTDSAPETADAANSATADAAQPVEAQQADPRQPDARPANTPMAAAPTERPQAAAPATGRGSTIEFDKDTYVASESDGSVRLRVKRDGPMRGSAAFTWSLRGNSAEAGADFAGIGPGSEEIPSGAGDVSVTIPLVSDALVENTELFLVELRAGDQTSLGGRSHAAVIIVDDD